MDTGSHLRKLHYRAHHRGTREADAIVGGYFDQYHAHWSEADFDWFEALLEEQDVDIMGWALGTLAIPPEYAGAQMEAFRKLDFVEIPR